MKNSDEIRFPVGLTVYKGDWEGAEWTVTGNPKKEKTVKDFESAYEFEDFLKRKINCEGMSFDSEYCQFFAYSKSKTRAVKFAKAVDSYFGKVRELLD